VISVNAEEAAALRRSHTALCRVTMHRITVGGARVLVGTVPIMSGTLEVDAKANVWRTLNANVPAQWFTGYSRDDTETLAIQSTEVTVELGTRVGATDYYLTLGRLRVDRVDVTETSPVARLVATDTASRITDFRLVTPYAPLTMGGTRLTYLEAILDLIGTAFPSAYQPPIVIDPAVDTTSIPKEGTVFQGDRWDAINSLAKAIGVVVHNDRFGRFVVRPTPVGGSPVWTFDTGVNGVMVDASTSYSRDDMFNAVAIRWDNPNGSNGLVYLVDSEPTSPTYYDGPFGRKPRPEETLDTVSNGTQALAAATRTLAEVKGLSRTVNLTSVRNYLVEATDTVAAAYADGTVEEHIIDGLTFDLAGPTTTYRTRMVSST
jgi:kumamolisin